MPRRLPCTETDIKHSIRLIDVAAVPAPLRGKNNTIRFLMPLAHVVCDANKSRAMIGFLTQHNFEPGKIPEPDSWFKPADFGDDQARQQQANDLDGQDIASIFIRFESGHSNNITITHSPFRPDMYPLRYLVHGTSEKNLPSIRRLGLLPGGTRGGRNHVHFALDCLLTSMAHALRPESDCILIARPGAVADLSPVITESRYVLTSQTVPFNRFCGFWSLIDRAWIEVPEAGELSRMNDYDSDIDICIFAIIHFTEKKNDNDIDNITHGNALNIHIMSLSKFPMFQQSPTSSTASDRQLPHRRDQSATLTLQMTDHVALRSQQMTSASINFVRRSENGLKHTCRRERRMTSHQLLKVNYNQNQ